MSRDVAVQKAEEEREKQEKRERVNKLREERCVGIFYWKQTMYLLFTTLGFVLMTLDWILNEIILDKYVITIIVNTGQESSRNKVKVKKKVQMKLTAPTPSVQSTIRSS